MNKQKFMLYFLIYTIATFVIGIIMKVVLVGWQGNTLREMQGMQFDPNHTRHMIEAGSGMGTQVILVIVTLIAYPASMIKLFKLARNPQEKWTVKNQKRLFKEYLIFLIVFIVFDLTAIALIVIEKAPMAGWTLFAVLSIFFPTSFACGTLVFLKKSVKYITA